MCLESCESCVSDSHSLACAACGFDCRVTLVIMIKSDRPSGILYFGGSAKVDPGESATHGGEEHAARATRKRCRSSRLFKQQPKVIQMICNVQMHILTKQSYIRIV